MTQHLNKQNSQNTRHVLEKHYLHQSSDDYRNTFMCELQILQIIVGHKENSIEELS